MIHALAHSQLRIAMTAAPTASTLTPRLTSLSHGGGCGCKIAPGVLAQILQSSGAAGVMPPELLVGIETADDAAVYQLNDSQALVEAMNELWHNDETASRYGENSRSRFEEMFTADHMIDAYINLYTSLLHEKPGS